MAKDDPYVCTLSLAERVGLDRLLERLIPAEEVAAMLRTAGAPEPWHDPDAVPSIGVLMLRKRDQPKESDAVHQKIQAAVNQLCRLIPGSSVTSTS